MKNILIATAAMAALATGANAQVVQNANWTVSGTVPAQCGVTTDDTTVAIPDGTIVNDNGRLRENAVQNALLNGFNATNTRAWCSGSQNRANLRRSALVRTDDGSAVNGFAEAILFDLGINIPDTTNPSDPNYDEGTSDGAGAGQLTERFGPTGAGSRVEFVDDSFPGGLLQPVLIDRPANDLDNGSTSGFTQLANQNTRLASGDYTAEVSLTFTPGV